MRYLQPLLLSIYTKRLYGIFFMLLICNCTLQKEKKNAAAYPMYESDTAIFKKDSFINRFGRYDPIYEFVKNDVKRGKFKVLEHGYDSMAIRLWYTYFEPRTQVVEIKKDNDGWHAEFFTIKRHQENDGKDTIVTVIRDTVIQNPKSGWDFFIQRMVALNITNFPNANDIEGYDIPMDGHSLRIEIATKKYYHLRWYPAVKANISIKEAKALD